MGSFGERLRREREMRKVTLEEMAAATKIGTRSLRALEDEEFHKLPGGIFNKGFVRSYAKFLGISEEQAVADYLVAAGEPENKPAEIDPTQLLAQHEAEKKTTRSRELESINASSSGFPWAALISLLAIVAATGAGWKYYPEIKARIIALRQPPAVVEPVPQSSAAAQPTAQVPAAAEPAASTPAPAQSAPELPATSTEKISTASPEVAAPANSNQDAAGDGFVLSIRATQDSWVSITADGKSVMTGTLRPSEEKSIRAHDRIVLKTGNAGGVEIAFNGKVMNAIGRENEVRRVTISADGSVQ